MDTNKIQLPHLDDFLLDLQTNNRSEETIYNYERDLKVFENFLNEINVNFDKINKKTILNYKAYLVSRDRKTPIKNSGNKKLASVSMNRMLSVLRSYLKFLTKLDYPLPVPPNAIELVKTEKRLIKVGEFEEIKKLIEAPEQLEKNKVIALRNRAILETLFSTGLRISELTNIKISDIDKNGRIFVKGKGKKERFVYLTPRAQKQIKKYLEGEEMGAVLKEADLVISRAGANTLTELAVLGKPCLLIPLPGLYQDEQTKNAEMLKATGIAEVLPQNKLTPNNLLDLIKKMLKNISFYQKNA